MAGIFVSYRRQDSSGWAGNLSKALIGKFGKDKVFFDIASLQPGVEYEGVIEQSLAQVDVILVLIGPRWLTITDDSGQRRLDDPKDLVRTEVAAALKRKVPLVPVLVGGAAIPAPAELPQELQGLAGRNGYELTDRRWDYDQKQLIKYLCTIVKTRRLRVTPLIIAALLILTLSIGAIYYKFYMPDLANLRLLKAREEQQEDYISYLDSIGFDNLHDEKVEIAVISKSEPLPIDAPVGTDRELPTAFYYGTKIFVHEDLLNVPASALTSYTHHALFATIGRAKNPPKRSEVEDALALYYPNSFLDDSDAIPWIDLANDAKDRPVPADEGAPSADRRVILAGAFWWCRSSLGQDTVDRVLLMAWLRSGTAEEALPAFNAALEDVAEEVRFREAVQCILDEFRRRGAPLVE